MKILLTNDDGFNAQGIVTLYETLRSDHEVILIAPDREKSAVSHSLTLNEPIRVNKINLMGNGKAYSITGTPADCVKLGLYKFYTSPPDLVISGINPGSNSGININYSGTVGAAKEAVLNGIPSIAASIVNRGNKLDFNGMAQFIAQTVDDIHKYKIPSGTFLNINAPDIPIATVKGVKITHQASDNLAKQFDKRVDPRNKSYYWYAGINSQKGKGNTDVNALLENYISITPIQCDLTDYDTLTKLESLDFKITVRP